jgi:hypothetical protein
MKSKKLTQTATKSGKIGLKAGSLGAVKTPKLAGNHNETLVRNA